MRLLASSDNAQLDSTTITVRGTTPLPTKPGLVRNLTLTAGNGSAAASWSAPSSGGSASSYEVRYRRTTVSNWTSAGSVTVTSKTITSLTKGASYRVGIRACNAGGCGSWISGTVTPPLPPGPVRNLALTAGSAGAAASWSAPSSGGSASSYEVRYKRTTVSNWTSAGSVTVTSKTITGLTKGASYNVGVRACNVGGCGSWVSGTVTPPLPPGSVGNLTLTAGNTSAAASWDSPSSGGSASSYEVRYKRTTVSNWTNAGSVTVTSKTITGLTKGASYQVGVRACNAGGCGSWISGTVTLSTNTPTPPGPVRNLRLTAGNASATANWSAPSTGGAPTSYKVRYKLSTASGWPDPESVTETSKTINNLTNGALYDVGVRACNLGGCGGWVSGTVTPAEPITPTPTPTPTPISTTCQAVEFTTPMRPGTTIEHDGNWSTACRHFRFLVSTTTHMIADLDGATSLQLRKSSSDWRRTLHDYGRSSSNPEPDGLATRIGRTVPTGWYVLVAKLDNPQSGGPGKSLDLDIYGHDAAMLDGAHQPDFAVGYQLNDNLTQDMEDELREGIRLWDNALSPGWPDINFCEWPDLPKTNDACVVLNYDKQVVAMRMASPDECGKVVACVGHTPPIGSDPHLINVVLRLENPGTGFHYVKEIDARFFWTKDSSLHLQNVRGTPGYYYWHLRGTVLHEIGHTIGAADQKEGAPRRFRYSLMGVGWPGDHTKIPDSAVEIVHQLYRHAGARKH